MTDEPKKETEGKGNPEKSDVEKLRDEFTAEFSTLKQSFESELNALKTENTTLKESNDELKRALVRSAINPAPEKKEAPKTEAELYKETIERQSKRTLELMSNM